MLLRPEIISDNDLHDERWHLAASFWTGPDRIHSFLLYWAGLCIGFGGVSVLGIVPSAIIEKLPKVEN